MRYWTEWQRVILGDIFRKIPGGIHEGIFETILVQILEKNLSNFLKLVSKNFLIKLCRNIQRNILLEILVRIHKENLGGIPGTSVAGWAWELTFGEILEEILEETLMGTSGHCQILEGF